MRAPLACSALVVVLVGAAAQPARAQAERLVVLELEGDEVDLARRSRLTEQLRVGAAEAAAGRPVHVLSRRALVEPMRRLPPCTDELRLCAARAGRAVQAAWAVVGEVRPFTDGAAELELVVVDVASAKVLVEDVREGRSYDALGKNLESFARDLVREAMRIRPPRPGAGPVVERRGAPSPAAPKTGERRALYSGAATLLRPGGDVDGRLVVFDDALRFESAPDARAAAFLEVPLAGVREVRRFNHMLVLPTGLEIVDAKGAATRLASPDRDRVATLVEERAGRAG